MTRYRRFLKKKKTKLEQLGVPLRIHTTREKGTNNDFRETVRPSAKIHRFDDKAQSDYYVEENERIPSIRDEVRIWKTFEYLRGELG